MNDDKMQIYIDKRLDHWAEWVLKGNWSGQGYPIKSILYDFMNLGCVLPKAKGRLPLPYDEDAEEMERCVMQMAKQKPKIAFSLRIQYLTQGTIQQKSKYTHSSLSKFKMDVQMAKQWLTGWFSANFAKSICA